MDPSDRRGIGDHTHGFHNNPFNTNQSSNRNRTNFSNYQVTSNFYDNPEHYNFPTPARLGPLASRYDENTYFDEYHTLNSYSPNWESFGDSGPNWRDEYSVSQRQVRFLQEEEKDSGMMIEEPSYEAMRPEEEVSDEMEELVIKKVDKSKQKESLLPPQQFETQPVNLQSKTLLKRRATKQYSAIKVPTEKYVAGIHEASIMDSKKDLTLKLTKKYVSGSTTQKKRPKFINIEIGTVQWEYIQAWLAESSKIYTKSLIDAGETKQQYLRLRSEVYPSLEALRNKRAETLKDFLNTYQTLTTKDTWEIDSAQFGGRVFKVKDDRAWKRLNSTVDFNTTVEDEAFLWTTAFKEYLPEFGDTDFIDSELNPLSERRKKLSEDLAFLVDFPIFTFSVQFNGGSKNINVLEDILFKFLTRLPVWETETEEGRLITTWAVRLEPYGTFSFKNEDDDTRKAIPEASLVRAMFKSNQKMDFVGNFFSVLPEAFTKNYETTRGSNTFKFLNKRTFREQKLLESMLKEIFTFFQEQYTEEGEINLTGFGFSMKCVQFEEKKSPGSTNDVFMSKFSQGGINKAFRDYSIDFLKNFSPKAFNFMIPHKLKKFFVGQRDTTDSTALQRNDELETEFGLPCTSIAFIKYVWVWLCEVVKNTDYSLKHLCKFFKEGHNTRTSKKLWKSEEMNVWYRIYTIQTQFSGPNWFKYMASVLKWANWIIYKVGVTKEVLDDEPVCVIFQESFLPKAPTFVMFEVVLPPSNINQNRQKNPVFHHVALMQSGKYEEFRDTLETFKTLGSFFPEEKKEVRPDALKFMKEMGKNKKKQKEPVIEGQQRRDMINATMCAYVPFSYTIEGKHWGIKSKKEKIEEEKANFLQSEEVTSFISWDIETFITKERPPFCSCLFFAETNSTKSFWGPECIEETLIFLQNYAQEKGKKFEIWTMNGSRFDFMYITPFLKKAFISGTVTNIKRILVPLSADTSKNLKGASLEFLDIGLTLSGSLNSLAKMFKLPLKKEVDFSLFTAWETVAPHKEKIIKYCNWDAQLVYEVFKKFRCTVNTYFKKQMIPNSFISASSLAFNIWLNHFYNPEHKVIGLIRNEYETLKKAYYGGYTQVLETKMAKGYYYDINSSYPFVMQTQEIPVHLEEIRTKKEEVDFYLVSANRHPKKAYLFKLDFFSFDPDTKIPTIPLKVPDGNLYVLNATTEAWVWDHLVDNFYSQSPKNRLNAIEVWIFHTEPVFREMIEKSYALKTTTNDQPMKIFAKLLMNSVYGKTGQRDFPEKVLSGGYRVGTSGRDILKDVQMARSQYTKSEDQAEKGSFYKIIEEITSLKFGERLSVITDYSTQEAVPTHSGALIFMASFITSFGRLNLFKMIQKCLNRGYKVAYADTDSLFCSGPFEESDIHQDAIGKWKLESEFTNAYFHGSKIYTFQMPNRVWVKKCKGIPKKVLESVDLAALDQSGLTVHLSELWNRAFGCVFAGEGEKKVRQTLNRRHYNLSTGESRPLANLDEYKKL